jgi:hypothetical protein
MRIRNKLATLALLLIFPFSLASEEIAVMNGKLVVVDGVVKPRVVIVGAEQPIELGEVVILKAELKDAQSKYAKEVKYNWEVIGKKYLANGNGIVFGAGVKNAEIPVSLKVELTYEIEGKTVKKEAKEDVKVKIGDNEPEPEPPTPPGPDPNPSPGPSSEIGKLVAQWIEDDLERAYLKKSKVCIVYGINQTIDSYNKGEIANATQLLTTLRQSNNLFLHNSGFVPQKWDKWSIKLQEYLYNEYKTGKLTRMPDYVTYLKNIAEGLESVK